MSCRQRISITNLYVAAAALDGTTLGGGSKLEMTTALDRTAANGIANDLRRSSP